MSSDSNPYDPNTPIPNPYEATTYGSPPYGSPPPPDPNVNNPPVSNPNYPPYPPASNPNYPPYQAGQNYQPYPYAPGNQPPAGNPYAPGQYQQYPVTPAPGAPPYQYPGGVPPLPGYNAGGAPAPKRSSMGLRIGIIVLVVLVIIIGAVAVYVPVHNAQVASGNATATALSNATATVSANATATVVASTYPFSANLKLDDPLTDNSRGYGWQTTNCAFTGGAYHNVDSSDNTFLPCVAAQTNFNNFTYQISMKILKGTYAGITFRGDDANSKFYAFVLGTDNTYSFFIYTHNGKPQDIKDGSVTGFNGGQANLVGVVARGSTFTFYVNKQEVVSITDSTYSSGQIGTISYDVGQAGEAAFTNAQVWTL